MNLCSFLVFRNEFVFFQTFILVFIKFLYSFEGQFLITTWFVSWQHFTFSHKMRKSVCILRITVSFSCSSLFKMFISFPNYFDSTFAFVLFHLKTYWKSGLKWIWKIWILSFPFLFQLIATDRFWGKVESSFDKILIDQKCIFDTLN